MITIKVDQAAELCPMLDDAELQALDRTGLSRRTLYTEISEGRFPKPVQLTKRRVGWPEADVEAFLTSRSPRDRVAA